MHDVVVVDVVDCHRDVAQHGDPLLERHPRGGLVQPLAIDELQREIRLALDVIDLVHAADVGVVETRQDLGLAAQPHRQVGIGAVDELDRDEPAEVAIARLVHHAHAALAEQLEQLVAIPAGDRRTGRRCRRLVLEW